MAIAALVSNWNYTFARQGMTRGRSFEQSRSLPVGKFRTAEHEEWEFPSWQRQEVGPRDGKHNLRCVFSRCSNGREILRKAAPCAAEIHSWKNKSQNFFLQESFSTEYTFFVCLFFFFLVLSILFFYLRLINWPINCVINNLTRIESVTCFPLYF